MYVLCIYIEKTAKPNFIQSHLSVYFSFDVRGKPLSQARHWSAPETFGSRAKFNTASDPATLDLEVRFELKIL